MEGEMDLVERDGQLPQPMAPNALPGLGGSRRNWRPPATKSNSAASSPLTLSPR
jgi:hypothetical protein